MKHIMTLLFIVAFLNVKAAKKPNVLLFIADELGYFDLSCTGSKYYETPHIDKLANSGVQFSNAYVAHPRCVPSRFAIQTGKFPARAQVPGGKEHMSTAEFTMGEAFQKAGYTTFFAGKWHLGNEASEWPQNQGYDINVGGCSAGAPISYFYPYNVSRNAARREGDGEAREIVGLDEGEKDEYLTDRLTTETIKFIKSHKDKPFFAVLSHFAVHTPFQAKQNIIDKYREKLKSMSFEGPEFIEKDGTTKMHQNNPVYAAMIESLDESLGNVIRVLQEEGLYDNTIIMLTSDHGGLSNRGKNSNRDLATTNYPLRAGKGHSYEGGLKVPCFVRYPTITKPGTTCDQITINTDIYPTLLEMAGLPLVPKQHLDGMSMLKALKGAKTIDRTFFWHSPIGRPNQTGDEDCSAVRIGNFKLIDFFNASRTELYDLKTDPYEKENLIEKNAKKAETLKDKLYNWKNS